MGRLGLVVVWHLWRRSDGFSFLYSVGEGCSRQVVHGKPTRPTAVSEQLCRCTGGLVDVIVPLWLEGMRELVSPVGLWGRGAWFVFLGLIDVTEAGCLMTAPGYRVY